MQRDDILKAIEVERAHQDEQWGGRDHDQEHSIDEWCSFIERQCRKASEAKSERAIRERLIKIAALAVAAIEAL